MNQEMREKRLARNKVDYSNNLYKNFKCIGSDCKLTCCSNWIISVDNETYDIYQNINDDFIKNNIVKRDDGDYMTQRHSDMRICNFLDPDDKFCVIQKQHGEEYLSKTCATYPRVFRKNLDSRLGAVSSSCHGVTKLLLNAKDDDFKFNIENDGKKNDKIENSLKIHQKFMNILNDENLKTNEMLYKIYNISKVLDNAKIDNTFSISNFTINNAFENIELKMKYEKIDIQNSLKNALDQAYYMINESVNKKYELLDFLKVAKRHFPYTEMNEEKARQIFSDWIGKYNENIEKIEKISNNYIKAVISEDLFPVYRTENFAMFCIILGYELILFKMIIFSLILEEKFDEENLSFAIAAVRRHFYGNKEERLHGWIMEYRKPEDITDLFFGVWSISFLMFTSNQIKTKFSHSYKVKFKNNSYDFRIEYSEDKIKKVTINDRKTKINESGLFDFYTDDSNSDVDDFLDESEITEGGLFVLEAAPFYSGGRVLQTYSSELLFIETLNKYSIKKKMDDKVVFKFFSNYNNISEETIDKNKINVISALREGHAFTIINFNNIFCIINEPDTECQKKILLHLKTTFSTSNVLSFRQELLLQEIEGPCTYKVKWCILDFLKCFEDIIDLKNDIKVQELFKDAIKQKKLEKRIGYSNKDINIDKESFNVAKAWMVKKYREIVKYLNPEFSDKVNNKKASIDLNLSVKTITKKDISRINNKKKKRREVRAERRLGEIKKYKIKEEYMENI